jgi:hypothetical protein
MTPPSGHGATHRERSSCEWEGSSCESPDAYGPRRCPPGASRACFIHTCGRWMRLTSVDGFDFNGAVVGALPRALGRKGGSGPRRVPLAILPVLASILLTAGCHSWNRLTVPAPGVLSDTLPLRDLVQIWTPRGSGSPVTWFAVVIGRDSVSGIQIGQGFGSNRQFDSPHPCCRVSLPLANVDSMRLGYYNAWTYILGGAFALSVAILLSTHT